MHEFEDDKKIQLQDAGLSDSWLSQLRATQQMSFLDFSNLHLNDYGYTKTELELIEVIQRWSQYLFL